MKVFRFVLPSSFPNWILALLWFFLLLFPKGGIKLGGIPLTWGYFLLGMVTIVAVFRSRFLVHIPSMQALFLILPFQIVSAGALLIHGSEELGFAISLFLSFFLIPWGLFFFISEYIGSMDLDYFLRLLKKGVLFIALYGVLLFFFKLGTGQFLEIPLLTVNMGDTGTIEMKHNQRGELFKLVSTYNNGNIYGICLLMLLPLYFYLEKRKWRRGIVRASLILTLSRTVWIGWLFSEILTSIIQRKRIFSWRLVLEVAMVLLAIFVMSTQFGGLEFIFDDKLGGRVDQIDLLEAVSFWPDRPFYGLPEIVYLGMLSNFGIVGLISFILSMLSAPIILLMQGKIHFLQKFILCGLINYLLISFSDGAVLYIPVMTFYWLLSALLLQQNSFAKQAASL